jgi:GT2 family glycosyltransferase
MGCARQPAIACGRVSDIVRGAAVGSPTVSVITPCYNTAAYVGETLASLFAQTFTDFEALVINDGSPDTHALEHALKPYRDRVVYIRQENRGLAGARNAGLRVARGRYIALLDSDDLWEPEYLQVHVRMLEADPSLDVVFPDARNFGDTPDAGRTAMEMSPLSGEITWRRLVAQECYVWGGVTMRAATVAALGGFDEDLRSSEDYDLWLRILRRGGRIGYHRNVLAHYRRRDTSLSANLERMFEHHLRIWDKLEQLPDLDEEERQLIVAQRRHTHASIQLTRGREAFFAGDVPAAVEALTEANQLARSAKLALVIAGIRIMPGVVLRFHKLRDRFIFRHATRD